MANRCLRCQRFKAGDGILLCTRCGPRHELRQDATVCPQTLRVVIKLNGVPVTAGQGDPPAAGMMRAKVGAGKSKLVAKVDHGKESRDRQSFETREMVEDAATDFYRQRWTDPETGDTNFRKVGSLKDPNMHGKASHMPTSPRKRPRPPSDQSA